MFNSSKHEYTSLVLKKDEYKALLKDHNAKFIKHEQPGNKPVIEKDAMATKVDEAKAHFI